MQGIAHGMKPKRGGIAPSLEVAREFVMKTSAKKRKDWSK